MAICYAYAPLPQYVTYMPPSHNMLRICPPPTICYVYAPLPQYVTYMPPSHNMLRICPPPTICYVYAPLPQYVTYMPPSHNMLRICPPPTICYVYAPLPQYARRKQLRLLNIQQLSTFMYFSVKFLFYTMYDGKYTTAVKITT